MAHNLRLLSILFLWLNAWLYLSTLVDLGFVLGLFVFTTLLAWGLARSGVRFLPSLLLAGVLPWAVRALVFFIVELVAGSQPSPWDNFYFWWDKNFFPLLPVGLIFWFLTWMALRYPAFLGWERLLNGLILAGVFWIQAEYKNATYPHPAWQALALTGFLLLELAILLLHYRPRFAVKAVNRGKARWPRSLLPASLVLLPLFLLFLWFLLSRYEEASVASGGGLMKPDLFRFDFSQFVRLESEITMSDDLVLLFRKEGRADRVYLRRFLLSGYSREKGFFVDPPPGEKEETIPAVGSRPLDLPDPGYTERRAEDQEFYIVNFDPSSLLAMNYPVRVVPYEKWDKSSFVGMYKVTSKTTNLAAWDFAPDTGDGLQADLKAHYTNYGGETRIAELAREVTKGYSAYYDKVGAVMRFLKDSYFYSLKPGIAPDGDQLSHFLFTTHKGYCSYFAFSMTLMLRSLGIPSRVAVGFFTTPQDAVLNFYPIRANQAHAWVEVWYDGIGWMEYDPTSENLAPGEDFRMATGLPIEQMSKLISEILNNAHKEQNEADKTAEDQQDGLRRWWESSLTYAASTWFVWLPVLWLMAAGLTHAWPALRRTLGRDRRRQTRQAFARAQSLSLLLGLDRRRGETVTNYLQRHRLDADHPLAVLGTLALKARFGQEFTEGDQQAGRRAWRGWKKDWLKNLPVWKRLVHAVCPWALGWLK